MSAIRRRWPTPTGHSPGSKNTLGDLCWLRESGMAHAVEQARQRKVPLLGICGGYQMLGETIIDEVESGLGAQPGLGC